MFTKSLKVITLFLTIVYGFIFILSLTSTDTIRVGAKEFIKYQISKEIHTKIDKLNDNKLVKYIKNKSKEKNTKLQKYKEFLKKHLSSTVNKITEKLSKEECECRKMRRNFVSSFLTTKINNTKKAISHLKEFIHYKYINITSKLIKDIQIASASSFLAMLLISSLLFFKSKLSVQINLLSLLMLLSTLAGTWLYIFKQNWFYTIIYNDYIGFWYMGYLAIVFLLIADIVFNKARVTTELLNAFFSAIGSAFSC